MTAQNNGGGAIQATTGGGLQFWTFTGAVGSETYVEPVVIAGSGNVVIQTTTPSTSTTTGALVTLGGHGVVGDLNLSGNANIGLVINGNAAFGSNTSNVNNVGFLGMPINTQSGSYTVTISDQSKAIYTTSTATVTIPSNSSVPFPIGTVITFMSGTGATTTIAITSDTMYLVGSAGTTGSRTLAAYGMASAVKVASTTWYISGAGLT